MVPLRMASIAGFSSPRGSMFHGSATNAFSPALGDASLGQSRGQALFNEGKRQLAIFDTLVERTRRLANQQVREEVINDYGLTEPGNKDKALYAREVVAGDIAKAEAYVPTNYYLYEAPGPTKNRPGRLADWNSSFKDAVEYAERTYGILPEPVVIERVVTVPGQAGTSPLSPILTVAAIGAAGVALLALLDVI